jgi:hypothetical protein
MVGTSVTTDAQVDQLIADVKGTMCEMEQMAESGKDAEGRLLARRWLDTLHRFADYAADCQGCVKRGR